MIPYLNPIVSDDIPLLTEADYECPICHAPLVEQLSILQGKLSNFKRQKLRLLSQFQAIRADQDWGKRGFKRNEVDLQ